MWGFLVGAVAGAAGYWAYQRYVVGSDQPPTAVLDPGEVGENDMLLGIRAGRVGDRTAVFATDGQWVYRYDGQTGEPWPTSS